MTTAPVLFQNMPPLTPEEYTALEASILEHGILSPVITDEAGVILDGHHRSKIASEHSISCPKQIVYGKTDTEKRTMALSLNLDRRHLNREQKRALVAESVKADPVLSDREHAKRTGVHHQTVGSVRESLESTGEIIQSTERVSADGRVRPAEQVRTAPANVNTDTGEIAPATEKPKRDRAQEKREWSIDAANGMRNDLTAFANGFVALNEAIAANIAGDKHPNAALDHIADAIRDQLDRITTACNAAITATEGAKK